MIRAVLVMVMAAAWPGHAAPLCVEALGIPRQCVFVDPGECRREAIRQGGNCTANPAQLRTPAGSGRFCTVEGGDALVCAYVDRATCQAEAIRRGGACVEATPAPGAAPNIDPFQIRRPY